MKIDLHTHSTASDGLYTPSELVKHASEAGLAIIALTDHDTTNGLREALSAGEARHLEVIPGIEVNTDISSTEVHVLGYFLEYQQAAFQQTLQTLRDMRVIRAQRMVEKLRALGLNISWERVRELAAGTVGRPHVAAALVEGGYAESVADAFNRYLGRGKPGYVPRYKLAPLDAIRLINSARGVPVLAHPAGIAELEHILPALCEAGLAGIEVYYGDYDPQTVENLKRLADYYHLIPTGGSDYHGPGIHPTPLGAREVPEASVKRLRLSAEERRRASAPAFELPPYQA
ncbi:MAG TPA: PHP domain-containing protein [Ktedonobacterales bacterium]|nr:PHP domain-containing protein [Ktedonobacterales bacterium]